MNKKNIVITIVLILTCILLGVSLGLILKNDKDDTPIIKVEEESNWVTYLLEQNINDCYININTEDINGLISSERVNITKNELEVLLNEMIKGELSKNYYNEFSVTPYDLIIDYFTSDNKNYIIIFKNGSSITSEEWDSKLIELLESEEYTEINDQDEFNHYVSYDYLWDYKYYLDSVINNHN